MAFTTVPDKNAGDVFTQAMWATYIEGNINTGLARMLGDTTLFGTAASIAFSSIPLTFAHLKLVLAIRTDRVATTDGLLLRFNGDSTANYHNEYVTANGTTLVAAESLVQTAARGFNVPAASSGVSGRFASIEITIPYYAETGDKFTGHWSSCCPISTASGTIFWQAGGFVYDVITGPITQVTLTPEVGTNFVAGTRATLYGLPA